MVHQVLMNSGSRTFFYDIQPEFKNGKLASLFSHFVLRHRTLLFIYSPRLNPKLLSVLENTDANETYKETRPHKRRY